MSQMIERKAQEKNAKIKTITNDDMVEQLRGAAESGQTLAPQLVTEVTLLDDKDAAAREGGAQEKKEGAE